MRVFPLLGLLFACALAPHARAEDPVVKLRSAINQAMEAVYGECCRDLPMEQKQARVREVIEDEFDLIVVIRRAMGRNWSLLEPEQQDRVVELVKQLIVKAYVTNLNGLARPEVEIGETISISEKRIEIPSVIRSENKSYNVLYRLGRMQSGWEIYDIVAENISVVSNYRQQFDDHFRRSDAEALIEKLQSLLQKDTIDDTVKL